MGIAEFTRASAVRACLVLACFGVSAAQQPNESPSFQLELNVDRLLVPVVVRDAHGNTVNDLKQEDFQVFDNGKLRSVSGFTAEQQGVASAPVVAGPAASRTAQPSAPPARITVFLFDDMHLTTEDLAHARAAGMRVIEGAILGTDLAAVVSISGTVNTGLTQDRDVLQRGLAQLTPHSIYRADSSECPYIDYYEADLIENKHDPVAVQDAVQKYVNCHPAIANPAELRGANGNSPNAEGLVAASATRALAAGRQDVLSTLAAVGALVKRMGQVPAQRSLVLVSPGFLILERESQEAESRIVDLAAGANVTISALDARGLYITEMTASQSSPALSGRSLRMNGDMQRSAMKTSENPMAELADGTGGTYFHNRNDLEAGLKQLSERPQTIYMLELPIGDVKRNGSLHRLSIKVSRRDVTVSARQTYFVPKPDKSPAK